METHPPPIREAAAAWLTEMRREFDMRRAGNVWFAATLHPCLGRRRDLECAVADAYQRLTRFDAFVAQQMFPGRWRNARAVKQRSWGILIAQDGAQGVHFHGLIAVPEEHVSSFLSVATMAWRAAAPFGSLDLPSLVTQADWAAYATRCVRQGQPIASAFLPSFTSSRLLPFTPRPAPHTPTAASPSASIAYTALAA